MLKISHASLSVHTIITAILSTMRAAVLNVNIHDPSRNSGLSHPFLGMGPGPLELGKIALFRLKLGKIRFNHEVCMSN